MKNVTFDYNYALFGSSIYFLGNSNGTFTSVNATNGFSFFNGGFVFFSWWDAETGAISSSNLLSSNLALTNFMAKNLTAASNAAVIQADNPLLNVYIESSEIISCYVRQNVSFNSQVTAVRIAEVIYAEWVNNITISRTKIQLSNKLGSKTKIGSFIKAAGNNQQRLTITNSVIQYEYESSYLDQDCFTYDQWASTLSVSPLISLNNGILQSYQSTYQNSRFSLGAGVFQLQYSSFTDSSSIYQNITSLLGAILQCYKCFAIDSSYIMAFDIAACGSTATLYSINSNQANIHFFYGRYQVKAIRNTQYLIQLSSQQKTDVDIQIINFDIIDNGYTFETGLLWIDQGSFVRNIYLNGLNLEKQEYLSTIMKGSALIEVQIQYVELILANSMKSRKLYDIDFGLFNITGFRNLRVYKLDLTCSSQSLEDVQSHNMLNNQLGKLYNPIFRVEGHALGQPMNLCSSDLSNCDSFQVRIIGVNVQNCHNFENGVFIQCTYCQLFLIRESNFNQISKSLEYSGGRSGIFQLDEKLVIFVIQYCSFSNIRTEGNTIIQIYQQRGALYIETSNFTNITTTLKKGGLFAIPKSEPESYKTINDLAIQRQLSWDVSLFISSCRFINISSPEDGSIIFYVQLYLRLLVLQDCYFKNVTSDKAGAILKQQGRSAYSSYFDRLTILQVFAYGGAIFDFDIQSYGPRFTNCTIQCFEPNAKILSNPLQDIRNEAKIPGSVIKIKFIRSYAYFYNDTVTNCVTLENGGFISTGEYVGISADGLMPYSVVMILCNFYNNSAYNGGALSISQGDINLDSCTFINNSAYSGGSIFLQAPLLDSFFYKVTVINSFAYLKGGFITLTKIKASATYQQLTAFHGFKDCYFRNTSALQGGAFNYEADLFQLDVINSVFIQSSAKMYGGVLYIFDAQQFNLIDSEFSQTTAQLGSIQYAIMKEQDYLSYHQVLEIDCNFEQQDNVFYLYGVYLQTYEVDMRNCIIKNNGSPYHISNSYQVIFSQSTFQNNFGVYGGVIKVRKSAIFFDNCQFINNTAQDGGAIYGTESIVIKDQDCLYQGNTAYNKGGAMYLTVNPEMYSERSICDSNQAYEASCIYVGHTEQNLFKDYMVLQIFDYVAVFNRAYMNTITFIMTYALLYGCYFQDNISTVRSNVLNGISSYIFLILGTFTTSENMISQLSNKTQGCYVSGLFGVAIDFYGSSFRNGRAYKGGAIYLGMKAIPYINNVKFINNRAHQGGAIYQDTVQYCSLYGCGIRNSYFENNLSDGQGDEIYMVRNYKSFKIETSTFNNTVGSQLIYAQEMQLQLQNLKIIGNVSNFNTYGGAMQFWNCHQVELIDSTIQNVSGYKGGAIYFYETDSFQNQISETRSKSDINYHIIHNSTIEHSSAYMGGAIFLDNSMTLNISQSFLGNNQAIKKQDVPYSGYGGAIYFTCLGNSNITQLYLDTNNTFQNNYAELAGGVLYWDNYEPFIFSDSSTLARLNKLFDSDVLKQYRLNNRAGKYGNEIASYFQKFKFIRALDGSTYQNDSLRQLDGEIQQIGEYDAYLREFQSGQMLPVFYIGVSDIYNQIINLDNTSTIQILPNTSFNQDVNASKYPPVVEGINSYTAVNGIITVDESQFYASPSFNHSIEISSKQIDLDKESSQQLMKEIGKSDLNFKIQIELRGCLLGEQFTPAGKCEICKYNTFSLSVQTEPGICQNCPEQAICDGGYDIGPKKNYWRPRNLSSYFIKCPYEGACLGKDQVSTNDNSTCSKGYQGIMCTDCVTGYYKSLGRQCEKCPSIGISIIRVIISLLGFLFLAFTLIKLMSSTRTQALTAILVYLRSLLNHFQWLMITTALNLTWPLKHLQDFFYASKAAATFSVQFLQMDCLIDQDQLSRDNQYLVRRYQLSMVVAVALPIFVIVVLLIITNLIGRSEIFSMKKYWLQILCVLGFLMHPSIIYLTSQNFNFLKIDGEERLQIDLELRKETKQHQFSSYYFAWPGFLIWGIMSPFFTALYIQRLSKNKAFNKFHFAGFALFLSGYQKKFEFLEPLKMLLKAGLLFILILTQDLGVLIQGILFMIFYLVYFNQIIKIAAFTNLYFQLLDNISICVQIITIYLGLFHVINKPEDWIQSHADQSQSSVALAESGTMAIAFVQLLFNYFYFGIWVFCFLKSIRKIFSKSQNLGYLAFAQNLKPSQNHNFIASKEIEKEFILEYLKMTSQLKESYEKRQIVVNAKSIKKLKDHLSQRRIKLFVDSKNSQDPNRNDEKLDKKDSLRISFKYNKSKKGRKRTPNKRPENIEFQPQNLP